MDIIQTFSMSNWQETLSGFLFVGASFDVEIEQARWVVYEMICVCKFVCTAGK